MPTAMDQASAVDVCNGIDNLSRNVSRNWKLEHIWMSRVLCVPETASGKHCDEAWMGSVRPRDAEMVKDRKDSSFPLRL
jgi:hypothetical protein